MKNFKKISLAFLLVLTLIPLSGCGKETLESFVKKNIEVNATVYSLGDNFKSVAESTLDSSGLGTDVDINTVNYVMVKLTNNSDKYINQLPLEVTNLGISEKELSTTPTIDDVNLIAAPHDTATFFVGGYNVDASKVGVKIKETDETKAKDAMTTFVSDEAQTGVVYPSNLSISTTNIHSEEVMSGLEYVKGSIEIKNNTDQQITADASNIILLVVNGDKLNMLSTLYSAISKSSITLEPGESKSFDVKIPVLDKDNQIEVIFGGQE